MGDSYLKPVFGSKDNIESAKENGDIDTYDLLLLDNGEVGWINGDNNTVFNTPRTQNEIVFSNGYTIEAGKTLDEITEILANLKFTDGNTFVEL